MKRLRLISNNLILKITSLNAVVLVVKLLISVFVQRFLAISLGEAGIAKIGQLRNVMELLNSFSTLGVFTGIVKYVSEFKRNDKKLNELFSTTLVLTTVASIVSILVLYFGASFFSIKLFGTTDYVIVIKFLAFIIPFIAVKSVCSGIINGMSAYKPYAKIELVSYILSSLVLIVSLYRFNMHGVLFAIALAPVVYFIILFSVCGKLIVKVLNIKSLRFNIPFVKGLLGFTIMSVSSHVLFNYVDIDVRNIITRRLSIEEAGNWTAMTNISKNYMIFASTIFTLYVLPKFAEIHSFKVFKKEVLIIYKSLLPLFGFGMIVIYLFRNKIIEFIYPNFSGLEPLFKWQLFADFVQLASVIMAYQFIAKRQVALFVLSELFSVLLFFFLAKYFVDIYGVQGVVVAHFIRCLLYFVLVIIFVGMYFKKYKFDFY
ncbi:O-antigen translocase [Aestuariibaculum sp. YM273]|uniref:O-antigen translocase n=1 Tax=Aestuariibaculum sp. YM273 TaxID=3070659 RepID=UPI0027DAB71D|nr:O-antigen translocase [Aestuariibaculum sp. YM273]WMI65929.1 O-antigen translocase [Aestuariibaculum sp. YM273]